MLYLVPHGALLGRDENTKSNVLRFGSENQVWKEEGRSGVKRDRGREEKRSSICKDSIRYPKIKLNCMHLIAVIVSS